MRADARHTDALSGGAIRIRQAARRAVAQRRHGVACLRQLARAAGGRGGEGGRVARRGRHRAVDHTRLRGRHGAGRQIELQVTVRIARVDLLDARAMVTKARAGSAANRAGQRGASRGGAALGGWAALAHEPAAGAARACVITLLVDVHHAVAARCSHHTHARTAHAMGDTRFAVCTARAGLTRRRGGRLTLHAVRHVKTAGSPFACPARWLRERRRGRRRLQSKAKAALLDGTIDQIHHRSQVADRIPSEGPRPIELAHATA